MKELLFYTIDNDYIKYLSQYDKHVSYNKSNMGHTRPYLGIVLNLNDYKYFVPLYSYKKKYGKYKNNPSFFWVYDRKNRPLSIIKFSSMIPIHNKKSELVQLLEYDKQEKKYKDLLSAEYRYINAHKAEIYKKAEKMYTAVTKHKRNFLKTVSCDFTLLEEKCIVYKNDNTLVIL